MKKIDFKLGIIVTLLFFVAILWRILMEKNQEIKNLNTDIEQLSDALEKDLVTKPSKATLKKPENYQGDIALIIDDFGYRNDEISDGFLAFKVPMTFAVIPGHRYSSLMGELSEKFGFEVIIHMPMESHAITEGEESFILRENLSEIEIKNRVNKAFEQIPQAVGMNNHQGSKATESRWLMRILGTNLRQKSKYFVDSRTTKETLAEETMLLLNVPTASRKVFIDNSDSPIDINRQIDQLVTFSKKQGSVLGIGHVKKNTLTVLQKRIPELQEEGFKFVFTSTLLH